MFNVHILHDEDDIFTTCQVNRVEQKFEYETISHENISTKSKWYNK